MECEVVGSNPPLPLPLTMSKFSPDPGRTLLGGYYYTGSSGKSYLLDNLDPGSSIRVGMEAFRG